ncbi:hypothetical protein ACE193_17995 [Bernardetia sp. OM2101]|uniref:hypothetical protein n=1 Tax=Bernardetia sp. OM2101 TaxID=3344876 RepID=UPI0035CF0E49
MSSKSDGFMYLVEVITEIFKARAKGLETRTIQSLGSIKGALCLTILLLLFDQVVIVFQKPTISLANSVDMAKKTNSYLGKCKVAEINLIDGYTLPKEFDIENHKFHLISKFQKRRIFLSWYVHESLDKKYIFYDEFPMYNCSNPTYKKLNLAVIGGQIPYIKLNTEHEEKRKTIPFYPYLHLELDDYKVGNSLKVDIVETFWNKRKVKVVGKLTFSCHCNS